jgi:hypothetical protein
MKIHPNVRKVAFMLFAGGVILTLLILFDTVIASSFYRYGPTWWVSTLILLLVLAVVMVAVYRLLTEMWSERRPLFGLRSENEAESKREQYFKVATLSYEIADQEHPEKFSMFIGEPLSESRDEDRYNSMPPSGRTPVRMVEDEIANRIKHLKNTYNDQVIVEYKVIQNSLEVYIAILATISLLAQYHDLVESAALFNGHMQRVLGRVTNTYHARTGCSAVMQQNMVVTATPLMQTQVQQASNSTPITNATITPNYVTVTPIPSNAININIGTSSLLTRGLGCALFICAVGLGVAVLLATAGTVYCRSFDSAGLCADILYRLIW